MVAFAVLVVDFTRENTIRQGDVKEEATYITESSFRMTGEYKRGTEGISPGFGKVIYYVYFEQLQKQK